MYKLNLQDQPLWLSTIIVVAFSIGLLALFWSWLHFGWLLLRGGLPWKTSDYENLKSPEIYSKWLPRSLQHLMKPEFSGVRKRLLWGIVVGLSSFAMIGILAVTYGEAVDKPDFQATTN